MSDPRPDPRHAAMVETAEMLARCGFARIGWGAVAEGKDVGSRTGHHWKADATDDPARVAQLLRGPRNALVIPKGRAIVIDVDRSAVWAELASAGLPPTFMVDSPTPGHGHVYGWVTEGIDMATIPGTFAGGEIRRHDPRTGTASMVLGPYSRLSEGRQYTPRGDVRTIAELPASVVDYLIASAQRQDAERRTARAPTDAGWKIAHGRHDYLVNRARNLRGNSLSGERLVEELLRIDRDRNDPPLATVPRRGEGEIREIARWADLNVPDDPPPITIKGAAPGPRVNGQVPEDAGAEPSGEPEPDAGPGDTVMERLGARPLSAVPAEPPPPLKADRLDPLGQTILYGTGGCGKGTLTAWWLVQLVREGERVLILDYENHPEEWARRIAGLAADAAASIVHVAPLTAAWRATRGPLWKQAKDIAALVAETHTTFVVVDSLVPACAGFDPLKPEAAALYAGGVEYIGLPTLSLAHVTKTEDLRYPFGSAFWHNLARTTWSLNVMGDGGRALLTHRKHNNYPAMGSFVVTITWRDDAPCEVWEKSYMVVLAESIDAALRTEALTVSQLVERLNDDADASGKVKADTVRKALRRGLTATRRRPQQYSVDGSGDTARYRRTTA